MPCPLVFCSCIPIFISKTKKYR